MTRAEPILGVDLGTSFSSAAAVVDGRIVLIPVGGDFLVPTVFYVPPRGDLVLGKDAVQQGLRDPTGVVSGIKRILGRTADDPMVRALDRVSGQVFAHPQHGVVLRVRDADMTPTQFVALMLRRLRVSAERHLGGAIRRAVLSVPAGATPVYCAALRRAAALAGLEADRLVPEPVAGAFASGELADGGERTVCVCDFGGGTFDITVVRQSQAKVTTLGVEGDPFLGGEDFDAAMADAVDGIVFRRLRASLRHDVVKWAELLWRCESVKRELSRVAEARLHMREAVSERGQWVDLDHMIERAWIEPRWRDLVARAVGVVRDLLGQVRLLPEQIDQVLLIGGTSLMPIVQRTLGALFPRPPRVAEDAQLAVVKGAALIAARVAAG